MFRRFIKIAAFVCIPIVGSVACGSRGIVMGEDIGQPVEFAPVDSGTTEVDADASGLTSYCPSSQCPPGWTTCPDSRFPCDTNILADGRNCGACGNSCPSGTAFEQHSCSEGVCKLDCTATGAKNCDGLVDNGCESIALDPKNCGACGVACAAGESCQWQDDARTVVGCGCPPGKVFCGTCRDLSDDDNRCGACNNRCDPTGGPGAPQYSNTYYGCDSGQCGTRKCTAGFASCDNDIENGCETSTLTDDDCGSCGNKCGAGRRCAFDESGNLACQCPDGLTFCQTGEVRGLPVGTCVDISSNSSNCGACGVSCGPITEDRLPKCDYGKCVLGCRDGWADCNGSQFDGCEIDTMSDPRNCGGCGITCDLILGQACVAGTCVVEPCDSADAGELTR
ncbi:MAG: hypothetical protein KF894_20020 [Labilithrix sp.]|nr:hypothetical protein [Labilithrix sp.]